MRYIDASIIDEKHLVPLGIWMKRAVAIILWLVSLMGTYVFFNKGEWEFPITQAAIIAFGIAIIYQLIFSAGQFSWRQDWFSLWYLGALFASVIPSIITYGPIVAPLWIEVLLEMGIPNQSIVKGTVWVIVFLLTIVIDAAPEQILVKRKSSRPSGKISPKHIEKIRQRYQNGRSGNQSDEDILKELLSQ